VEASGELTRLLAERGNLDEGVQMLRAWGGTWLLAELLAEGRDLEGLRARADAGDVYAALNLAGMLARREDLDRGQDW
jgi:hypothetical protein